MLRYAFETDGTKGGIEMRATLRGRDASLVAMVSGDRRDAALMLAVIRKPDRCYNRVLRSWGLANISND